MALLIGDLRENDNLCFNKTLYPLKIFSQFTGRGIWNYVQCSSKNNQSMGIILEGKKVLVFRKSFKVKTGKVSQTRPFKCYMYPKIEPSNVKLSLELNIILTINIYWLQYIYYNVKGNDKKLKFPKELPDLWV